MSSLGCPLALPPLRDLGHTVLLIQLYTLSLVRKSHFNHLFIHLCRPLPSLHKPIRPTVSCFEGRGSVNLWNPKVSIPFAIYLYFTSFWRWSYVFRSEAPWAVYKEKRYINVHLRLPVTLICLQRSYSQNQTKATKLEYKLNLMRLKTLLFV